MSTKKHRRIFLGANEPPYICAHCGEEIVVVKGQEAQALVVHHDDENQRNNDPANLVAMHLACHTSHHLQGKARTPAQRAHLSKVNTGKPGPNKGKRWPADVRAKHRAARLGKRCPPGCTCKRHNNPADRKCPPGCVCGLHAGNGGRPLGSRMSPEGKKKIRAALVGRRCPDGCTCGKHRGREVRDV